MFSINLPLDKKIRVFKDIYGISCCFSEKLKFFSFTCHYGNMLY